MSLLIKTGISIVQLNLDKIKYTYHFKTTLI